jgi:hypothetical protein
VLGVQQRAQLAQVDAQVLAMGADRQAAGAAPTATQARQTTAHNTPTAAL